MADRINYLSKFIIAVSFDEESQLNLTAHDMGESMVTFTPGENTGRAPAAVGSVPTANIAVEESISISVKKTSPSYAIWKKQVEQNGILKGTCTVTDDVGEKYTFSDLSIVIGDHDATATSAEAAYTIIGNRYYNRNLAI